tara:strand:+ start:375 stop:494 length:120 start_codon:yes stop_codon:yes gene_type:complete
MHVLIKIVGPGIDATGKTVGRTYKATLVIRMGLNSEKYS